MAKKARKNPIEEELEAMDSQNEVSKLLDIVKKHADSVGRTKLQYLDENEHERYAMYANIESAFDLMLEDMRMEGFKV